MKKLLFLTSIALFINLLLSCGAPGESSDPIAEKKAAVEMKVDGMVCAMGCAKYIQDKVADLDGVLSSEVKFEEGLAHFVYDENVLSADDLEQFIDDIHDGQYEAEIIEASTINHKQELNESKTVSESKEVAVIQERFQITFPDLLGYFLHSLR